MKNKNNFSKIKIKELIHSNLGMNSSARNLFKELNQSPIQNFEIDFSDVIFMSRSFTQEYIYQKNKTKKNIYEVNVPLDVSQMFEVVEKDFKFKKIPY